MLKYSCVLPGISPSFKPFVLLTDHPSNQDGLRIGSPRWEFFWFFCLNEQKLPVASLEGRGRLISLLTLPKLQKQERVYSSLKSLCCIAETTQHYKSTALQRKKKKRASHKVVSREPHSNTRCLTSGTRSHGPRAIVFMPTFSLRPLRIDLMGLITRQTQIWYDCRPPLLSFTLKSSPF